MGWNPGHDTNVSLRKANHHCFEKVERVLHSALPDRLLHVVVDTLKDCEGGNPVSVSGLCSNVPLVAVDLGHQ